MTHQVTHAPKFAPLYIGLAPASTEGAMCCTASREGMMEVAPDDQGWSEQPVGSAQRQQRGS